MQIENVNFFKVIFSTTMSHSKLYCIKISLFDIESVISFNAYRGSSFDLESDMLSLSDMLSELDSPDSLSDSSDTLSNDAPPGDAPPGEAPPAEASSAASCSTAGSVSGVQQV